MPLKEDVLKQLDQLITEGHRLESSMTMGDIGQYESSLSEAEFRAFATAGLAAIRRVAGEKTDYYRSVPNVDTTNRLTVPGYSPIFVPALLGSLTALRSAVDGGLLVSLEDRLRANVHDDFLQQSKVLLSAGYHVAAMVLIGGVLEDHLRKLCANRTLTCTGSGNLAKYNDLLKDTVYPQTVWRRIQAIGDVRNEAAHGNGTKVTVSDVEDAHGYVSRCLADYPA